MGNETYCERPRTELYCEGKGLPGSRCFTTHPSEDPDGQLPKQKRILLRIRLQSAKHKLRRQRGEIDKPPSFSILKH